MKKILLTLALSVSLVACGKIQMHAGVSNGGLPTTSEDLPSEALSSMSVNGPFLADGTTPTNVRIQLTDSNGKPLAGIPVSLSVSGDRNVVGCSHTTLF